MGKRLMTVGIPKKKGVPVKVTGRPRRTSLEIEIFETGETPRVISASYEYDQAFDRRVKFSQGAAGGGREDT